LLDEIAGPLGDQEDNTEGLIRISIRGHEIILGAGFDLDRDGGNHVEARLFFNFPNTALKDGFTDFHPASRRDPVTIVAPLHQQDSLFLIPHDGPGTEVDEFDVATGESTNAAVVGLVVWER